MKKIIIFLIIFCLSFSSTFADKVIHKSMFAEENTNESIRFSKNEYELRTTSESLDMEIHTLISNVSAMFYIYWVVSKKPGILISTFALNTTWKFFLATLE